MSDFELPGLPKQEPETPKLPEFKKEKKEKKPKKKLDPKYMKKLIMILLFGITASFLIWSNNVRTTDNANILLITMLSVMANVILITGAILTNVGFEIIIRFINRFKYRTGKYVNTVFHYKTGIQKELFVKKDKDTGAFKIDNHNYTTNPTLLFNYKGIPTYHHREGTPDPLNIWRDDIASEMSNAEIDTVMLAGAQFDFKQWLEQNKQIILIAIILIVAGAAVAGYFGYQSHVMLRDGTYKAVDVICKNLPQIVSVVQ